VSAYRISWVDLTCIAEGVDDRFAFAAPSTAAASSATTRRGLGAFQSMGPERAQRWLSLWDPSSILPKARCVLWVTGRTFRLSHGLAAKSYFAEGTVHALRAPAHAARHGAAGENPRDSAFGITSREAGPERRRSRRSNASGGEFVASVPLRAWLRAELNYTADRAMQQRNGIDSRVVTPARCGESGNPVGIGVYYVYLYTT
jgi:hypothetical protein